VVESEVTVVSELLPHETRKPASNSDAKGK
jgi:hypothetical protein